MINRTDKKLKLTTGMACLFIAESIFTLFILFFLSSESALAACSCQSGTRGSFIGIELTAKGCPPADADENTRYTYINRAVKCLGDEVSLFSNWGDTTGTPARLTALYASSNMRVFQNQTGTHIVAVHSNFNGKINGLSMTDYAPGNIYTINAMGRQCVGFSENTADNDGDGIPACLDCSDNNPEIGSGVVDNDNDGVPACVDCNDSDKTLLSGKGINQDQDPFDACTDCNDFREDTVNTCLGCPTQVGEPVDYFTGVMTHDLNLIDLPGAPIPLTFTLHYDSRKPGENMMGIAWEHTHSLYLAVMEDSVQVQDQSQRPPTFYTYDSGNTYYPVTGTGGSLIKTDKEFVYTLPNADIWIFDLSGRIVKKTNPHGLSTRYEYNESGQLISVTDPSARTLVLSYYPQATPDEGLLMSVEDPAGNMFRFKYTDRILSTVVYPDQDDDPVNNPESTFFYNDFPDEGLSNGTDSANMTKLIDTRGNALSWSYDTSDRAVLTSGPQGTQRLDLTYENPGTTIVVNSRSSETTYSFDQETRTQTIEGPGCSTCSSTSIRKYNAAGHLIEIQDGEGNVTQYLDLDKNGNPGTTVQAAGTPEERITYYTYHPKFNKISTRREKGLVYASDRETVFTYDETTGDLLLVSQKGYSNGEQLTLTTQYTYNDRGQPVTIDGPREGDGDTITITYDSVTGFMESITRPLSGTETFDSYNALGYPGTVTDANGNTRQFFHDHQGRILQHTGPEGENTQYQYDAEGNLVQITLPTGDIVEYGYDHANQLTGMTDSLGNRLQYIYDTEGNIIRQEVSDPDGLLKQYLDFKYDAHNRLQKIIYPDATFTQYGYDENNNQVLHVDPAGKSTQYTYNALNRMISQTDASQGLTTYSYDTHQNLTSVTDPNGNTIQYEHDDFGRRVSESTPDTGSTLYEYDAAGNLIKKTDARGLMTTYEYDVLNRLTAAHYPDPSQDITYAYDEGSNGKGKLTGMQDASGKTQYIYTRSGKIAKQVSTVSGVRYVTGYTYDVNGNPLTLIYPDGSTVRYRYEANLLSQVSIDINNQQIILSDAIRFEPFSGITHMELNNGMDYDLLFDNQNRPAQITYGNVLSRQYGYHPSGNIEMITDNLNPVKNQSFIYDDLNRLEQATGIYGTINLGYDPVGNRISRVHNDQTENYIYKPDSNLLEQVTGSQTKNFEYDAAGNIIKSNNITQVYNTANRLLRIIENNTLKSEYTYNGKGQRIKKRSGNTTHVYHYDSTGNIIAISDDQGNLKEKYIYIGSQRIARIDLAYQPLNVGDVNADSQVDTDDALMVEQHLVGILTLTESQQTQADVNLDGAITAQDAMLIKQVSNNLKSLPSGPATETLFYFINDHLGTPLAITDQTGVKVWEADYLPFGQIYAASGNMTQNFRFPGQYFDTETGLRYNWHRYYDSMTGRYLTPDPIGLTGGINFFIYSHNNPINLVDPEGLRTFRPPNNMRPRPRWKPPKPVNPLPERKHQSFDELPDPIDPGYKNLILQDIRYETICIEWECRAIDSCEPTTGPWFSKPGWHPSNDKNCTCKKWKFKY